MESNILDTTNLTLIPSPRQEEVKNLTWDALMSDEAEKVKSPPIEYGKILEAFNELNTIISALDEKVEETKKFKEKDLHRWFSLRLFDLKR